VIYFGLPGKGSSANYLVTGKRVKLQLAIYFNITLKHRNLNGNTLGMRSGKYYTPKNRKIN